MPLDNSIQILKKHSLFENLSEDVLKHIEKPSKAFNMRFKHIER